MHHLAAPLSVLALLAPSALSQASCGDPPLLDTLGGGTAGALGVPRIDVVLGPFVGEPSSFAVEGGAPGAPGAILLGATATPLPLPGFGATWFPAAPFLSQPFVLGAEGAAAPPFGQPTVASGLCGVSVTLQSFVLDPTAQGGVAFTGGHAVRFGARGGPLLPARSVAGGPLPDALALADLDGDGDLDAAVASRGIDAVTLLLNDGDGRLVTGPAIVTGDDPTDVAAADLDGDGAPDLVTADLISDTVTVSLAAGGGFLPPVSYPVSSDPTALDVGDFDANGTLDLVVVHNFGADFAVLWGQGDGTFVTGQVEPVVQGLRDVVVADLTGDGVEDLAAVGGVAPTVNRLTIHVGRGDGTFEPASEGTTPPSIYFPGFVPLTVRAGDLDLDGDLDLVVGVCCGSITVLLNGGGGAFGTAQTYDAGGTVSAAELGDLDGDGVLDAVVTLTTGPTAVLSGNGDGSFAPPVVTVVGGDGTRAAVGDLDGDGHLDVAQGDRDDTGRVVTLLNDGSGALVAPDVLDGLPQARSVTGGDFDRDGRTDLLVASRDEFGANIVAFFSAPFAAPGAAPSFAKIVAPGFLDALRTVDVDADGLLDVAGLDLNNDTVAVLRGLGDGTFAPAVSYVVGAGPVDLEVADLDLDGLPDLLAVCDGDSGLWSLRNLGGTFAPAVVVGAGLGIEFSGLAVGDLDGDGSPDAVGSATGPASAAVFLGRGDGTFDPPSPVGGAGAFADVALVDLDEDGILDLALGRTRTASLPGGLVLRTGLGDGSFGTPQFLPGVFDGPLELAVGDLDRDGREDLVAINSNGIFPTVDYGSVSFLRALGVGAPTPFAPPEVFVALSELVGLHLADVDGDGLVDVLANDLLEDSLVVFPNQLAD